MLKGIPVALILVGIIIIFGYYILPEIQYQSDKIVSDNKIIIPKIGVNESINTNGIDYGVFQDRNVLFGHRTTHGAPFFNLDKLVVGDQVFINRTEYKVVDSYIIDAEDTLTVNQYMYLVTCTPIGSTSQRIVIKLEEK